MLLNYNQKHTAMTAYVIYEEEKHSTAPAEINK